MLDRYEKRGPRSAVLASLFLAFASSAASALEPPSEVKSVSTLARVVCDTGIAKQVTVDLGSGYLPMLGMTGAVHALRVLRSGDREAVIAAERCREPRLAEDRGSGLVLSHFFSNRAQLREGYYYLTTLRGELLKAVHMLEGRSNPFAVAPLLPLRRADFEGEKALWLTKIAREPALVEARAGR